MSLLHLFCDVDDFCKAISKWNDLIQSHQQNALTRHRSVNNFLVNVIAYTHQPKKPALI